MFFSFVKSFSLEAFTVVSFFMKGWVVQKMKPKGKLIDKLSMFLKYGLTEVISHKTVETGGKIWITYVWCTVCAKFKFGLSPFK